MLLFVKSWDAAANPTTDTPMNTPPTMFFVTRVSRSEDVVHAATAAPAAPTPKNRFR